MNKYNLSDYSEHDCVLVKKYRFLSRHIWVLDDSGKKFKVYVGEALYNKFDIGTELTLGRIGRQLNNISKVKSR